MHQGIVWIFLLYLVDFAIFVAALFCLIFFLRYRGSPLVKASHSNVDNGVLILAALFCIIPVFHFGEMSYLKCLCWWLAQNIIFAIYCGLLFTKIPYLTHNRSERKAASKQAGHIIKQHLFPFRAQRRFVRSFVVVMLSVVITMVTIPFSDVSKVENPACLSRAELCSILGDARIFTSIVYTWSLLLTLSVVALTENYGAQKSWKIPWLIFVEFLSYTALLCCSVLSPQCSHDFSWFNFIVYLIILINPTICLATLYIPKVRQITKCSFRVKCFKKPSRAKQKASRHFHRHSIDDVIVNYSPHAGCDTGQHEVMEELARLHASFDDDSSRPESFASSVSSRLFNIPKSIKLVSSLFKAKETGYRQLFRRPSLYDNVLTPITPWDKAIEKASQSTLTTVSSASFEDDPSECGFDLTEITFDELREMTEFLKCLKTSDV